LVFPDRTCLCHLTSVCLAFRDRNAGAYNNRAKPTDEIPHEGRIPVTGVKNRDIRANRTRDDRHSRTDRVDTNKQVEQGWGAPTGESNWKDEQAGEAIAQKEEKETGTAPEDNGVEGDAVDKEAELEDKSKSYAEYLAELQETKQPDLGIKEARKPNEGSKPDKKWAQAKELKRLEEDQAYFKGKEEKARRERQRKEKAFVDVDMRFVEQPRGRGDGPRGRGRAGDRGRGGRGRADTFRPPRGGDGAPRGGRVNPSGPTVDEKNFPSLGASK